jgi:hypothetical protein
MRAKSESFSIVVIGAWNPAIFTPEWVAFNLCTDPNAEVGLSFSIGDAAAPRRLTFEDVELFPGRRQIAVLSKMLTVEGIVKAADVVSRILNTLIHTPVAEAGINYGFESNSETELLRDVLLPADSPNLLMGYTINNTSVSRQLCMEGKEYQLNFVISDNNPSVFSFNYHYALSGFNEYINLFKGDAVTENYHASLALLNDTFGLTLSEEVDQADDIGET